ncbi:DUF262 domain-containing protein [Polyangium mundeleinium]|uniref:DUF262 domain-containing protein n=1 Tax=Polyangium mundeleinium TaxID=2995306 RepID=A0ABT5EW57_9BACT|nr:DUF262 domain-containing protein [Polyangium mundeleinium]MDC0745659.1 DUF262 domain-containing protein [Polyangium mundeleinium]
MARVNPPEEDKIIEEHEENQATGVEAEDEGAGSAKPYDPTKIRVDPKTFSLRQICDMIDDGDLDLAPDFQRNKVWKAREKSRLIESILLRIPLPAFYFSADGDGRLRVVDGLQRLSTVYDFVRGGEDKKGAFALKDLEYLEEGVVDARFDDLDANWKRRIQQTQINVNVIDPQTPSQVKFDIFKRLNTGGTPLKAQEIRHCMSQPRSRDFLKACTGGYRYLRDNGMLPFEEYKALGGVLPKKVYEKANDASVAFGEATDWALSNHLRMADREAILRFCAFRLIRDDLDQYGESNSMDDFLTGTTERLDDKNQITDKDLLELAVDLEHAMRVAQKLFGDRAFRKWRLSEEGKNPINRPLFESWAVVLADSTWEELEPRQASIVKAARKKMTGDARYIDAISAATGDPAKVKLRFEAARKIVKEAKP